MWDSPLLHSQRKPAEPGVSGPAADAFPISYGQGHATTNPTRFRRRSSSSLLAPTSVFFWGWAQFVEQLRLKHSSGLQAQHRSDQQELLQLFSLALADPARCRPWAAGAGRARGAGVGAAGHLHRAQRPVGLLMEDYTHGRDGHQRAIPHVPCCTRAILCGWGRLLPVLFLDFSEAKASFFGEKYVDGSNKSGFRSDQ